MNPLTILIIIMSGIAIAIIIEIIKAQKICDKCNKRMWFWQTVVLRPQKKMFGSKVTTVYTAIRHVKCKDENK